MRGRTLGGCVVAMSIASCTLVYPLDGYVGTVDGGGSADASDGASDAPLDTASDTVADDASGSDGGGNNYRTVVMSDGPVAYYRLGDPSDLGMDETGAHHGKVVGTVSSGPGAIARDGDGAFVGSGKGWIDIGQIYPFSGNASYSIEAWVAPMPSSTLTGVLSRNLAQPGMSPSDGYSLYVDPSNAPTMGRWLSTNEEAVSAPALSAVTYTHVVGTYDGTTLRMYVSGALANAATSKQSLNAPSAELAIGATRNGNYGYFVGALDEVALYDKALSPARIAAHYAAGTVP